MTEREAIAFLGLSARTLRNYRKKGKLGYREVPGKTRPTIEYERTEVERLHEQIERRRQRGKKLAPSTPSLPRVTFGLAPEQYEALAQEAARFEMGVNEYARRLTKNAMEGALRQEMEELRQELVQNQAATRKMKREIASAFEVVLERLGFSEEAAKTWVDRNLR